jgi:thioesterase-3
MKIAAEIQVRGYHCDGYGHVNNARYLELLEESRWQALEAMDEDQLLLGGEYAFYIARIDISFIRGLVAGDTAVVGFRFDGHEGPMIHATQEICRKKDGKICTSASISFVLIHRDSGKKTTPDHNILRLFHKFA